MKNVLLLAMSTLGRTVQDNYYRYGNGEVFSGRSQLEPITRMLDMKRREVGERLDQIIILETAETLRIQEGHEKSAVDFYKERVGSFLGQGVEYVEIQIDEAEPAEGIARAVSVILRENEKQKRNRDKIRLWIDTQGGFRDVVMVFNAIISLLKEQEIEPEGIYSIRYSQGNTKDNPCPIIDQTKKYDIFKFVSAMQEFMDYGKAGGLKKYYGEENGFVQTVAGIADAIQMCRPQEFEEAVRKFAQYLQSGDDKKDDPYLQIFLEFMKSDYGILLEQPDNTIEQIKWCVKKEFYQQAMTFYIERMPKYYYEKGWLNREVDVKIAGRLGKNPYAEVFYEDMFDEMLADENDEQLQAVLKAAAERKDVNVGRRAAGYLRTEAAKISRNKVKGAVEKVERKLRENFDREGKPQGAQLAPGCAKTVQAYLNSLCAVQGRPKRYNLLYGIDIPKGTYAKKLMAVRAAKEKKPGIVKIMEYYMIMKILRNRMNHASENLVSEDEQKAIAFFASEGIETGIRVVQGVMQFDYRKIAELIMDGVALVPAE